MLNESTEVSRTKEYGKTIPEAKQLRSEVEAKISQLLTDFSKQTDLSLQKIDIVALFKEPITYVVNLRVEI